MQEVRGSTPLGSTNPLLAAEVSSHPIIKWPLSVVLKQGEICPPPVKETPAKTLNRTF